MVIYPKKLKKGDEIRILAPSSSMSSVSQDNITLAKLKLQELGYKVSFGQNSYQINDFNDSSSIQARVWDLHEAFSDPNVKMILPVIGGYHSNQLLDYLDYDLIRNNPKILGGYSDTTALQNAITTRTGLVTYSTIAFIMMSKIKNNEYSFESFLNCLTLNNEYKILPPKQWDDSQWYINQDNYKLHDDTNFTLIQETKNDEFKNFKTSGRIIGGHLGSLRLLQGTKFFPDQKEDYIYFLEECAPSKGENFDRELQSLLHASNLKHLKGILIGRFQIESQIDTNTLKSIISQYRELKNLPIICNVPFGHTYPISSFPIGGVVELEVINKEITIKIVEH